MSTTARVSLKAGPERPQGAKVRIVAAGVLALLTFTAGAHAVQVQDVVRLKGAERSKLVGMGLVVGLNGTGDGGDFLPAMRPLAEVIGRLIDPNVVAAELEDAENVALVALSAEIPAAGVREGDRVDVHVNSVGPAESLAGGRLFLMPMIGPHRDSAVYAFAEGAVTIEDADTPTAGVVEDGAQLTRDVMSRYLDPKGRITLVINDTNASWPLAHNLASLINGLISPDGAPVAQAIDQKNVVVEVPQYERDNPAAFISQILQTYIDPTQVTTAARVVINERTGTIVISGNVQISPAIISHKGLTINTIAAPQQGDQPDLPDDQEQAQGEQQRFITIDPEDRGGAELSDLLAAFNQLKVEAEDRIAILKLMHEAGHLHAQLIIE
ncbi:MAG: flagellar basal body P-ring protein FlgI [Phycisphaeraceae bacterium]